MENPDTNNKTLSVEDINKELSDNEYTFAEKLARIWLEQAKLINQKD